MINNILCICCRILVDDVDNGFFFLFFFNQCYAYIQVHIYILIYIERMQDKDSIGKTIQKYRIQSLLQTKPNNISIFRSINVTNNESLILKKMAISDTTQNTQSQQTMTSQSNKSQPSLLYNELNNIKQINIHRILRCLQMIKTKRSLYLVYQNYPEFTLERFLKDRAPVPALRVRFAKILCEVLQEIHKKNYVYVNLLPTSIYVICGSNLNPNSYQLRFVGFEYAKKINPNEKTVQVNLDTCMTSNFTAPEIINSNSACFQSDIYSAGKIFQLMGLTQIKGKTDHKMANQTISQMIETQASKRPSLSKIWECLKLKQGQVRLFDFKVLELVSMPSNGNRGKADSSSQEKVGTAKMPIKRNIQDEERRLKKVLKIRSLVIYLHDLANFSLKQKNKTLFYLLLKKSVIVRANLVHELKKMLSLYSGQQYNRLNHVKQTLIQQQNETLNLLTKTQENLRLQAHPNHILYELENRNELSEQLMEEYISQFVTRKKKQIKPFHSILDEQQRNKLIHLCGLAEKLVYGSFEKFFDEVVDDSELQLGKQKYFGYLKSASTKEICDRLEKILKQKGKAV